MPRISRNLFDRLTKTFLATAAIAPLVIILVCNTPSALASSGDDQMHEHHKHPVPALASSGDDQTHEHHKHPAPASVSRNMVNYTIPDITMLNQHAEKVSVAELFSTEQPVLLNFIFTTCPAICPVMSATFSSVQNELGKDSDKIRMISVSIDPEQDRPTALLAYAKRFNAGPQWEFLTGSMDDSLIVQKAFASDRGDKMNHAPATFLRATMDSPWIRYDGFTNLDQLVNEIRGFL